MMDNMDSIKLKMFNTFHSEIQEVYFFRFRFSVYYARLDAGYLLANFL